MISLASAPDAGSYTESTTYSTKVFTSVNGLVNTEPGMLNPLYSVKYTTTIFHTGLHRGFINTFRKGLTETVVQPLWGQGANITQSAQGVTTIPCTYIDSNFEVGGTVFVSYGYARFYEVTLMEKTAEGLIVGEPVDIVKEGLVLPSFVGVVSGEINTNYSGENFSSCEVYVKEFR